MELNKPITSPSSAFKIPLGNTYEGTGSLNTDFFLSAGQTAFKTEIFSFLPRPGVSYMLVARFGVSGLTYDPLQFTF